MKRLFCIVVAACLLLTLAACGQKEEKTLDMDALYESYQQYLPEMFMPDEDTMLNFLGVHAEDCTRYKVAICAEGLRADEVWLMEAKDEAALQRLKDLAQARIQSKLDETESYAPDQYLIVQKAAVVTNGRYLGFFISPDVDSMKAGFESAFQ